MVCADFCVVDNMVCMCAVNIGNKTWRELISVVYNVIRKSSGGPEALTWCSLPPLHKKNGEKTWNKKKTMGVVLNTTLQVKKKKRMDTCIYLGRPQPVSMYTNIVLFLKSV